MSDIEVIDHSPEVLDGIKRAKRNMLWAIGATAEGHAKRNITVAPRVDTGRLRNSVTHVEDDDATYIGSNVEYAPYVELGTGAFASSGSGRKDPWVYKGADGKYHFARGMRPIHFLKRAATEHKDEYSDIATDAMENA